MEQGTINSTAIGLAFLLSMIFVVLIGWALSKIMLRKD